MRCRAFDIIFAAVKGERISGHAERNRQNVEALRTTQAELSTLLKNAFTTTPRTNARG